MEDKNKDLKPLSHSVSEYELSEEELDQEFLRAGIEYPKHNSLGEELFDSNGNIDLSPEERQNMIKQLEQKFVEVMEILRISRNDPNCANTALRVAKMYVNELMAGRFSEAPKITVFPNRKNVDELIISKGIEVMSLCSHHMLPISGYAAIGYIPGDHVVGLSKLSRVVEWFGRRPQIQEEMGEQIADYLENMLRPKALGVVIKARHYCMIARGVRGNEDSSLMVTSVMRGLLLREMNLRNEFLNLIK